MKKIALTKLTGILAFSLFAQQNSTEWPILKHYDQDHLLNIALPLGGIGTGTFSLGGRGELRDWNAWGTCKIEGNQAALKVLSGKISLRQFTLNGIGSKKMKVELSDQSDRILIEI